MNSCLRENIIFHVMEVLVQHIPWLTKFKDSIPKFIEHDFIHEMKVKWEYKILDLLEKSENKADEMIEILQTVHKYVPSTSDSVIERVVFGGDELTNEWAYQSQLEMQNGTNEADCLKGLIHHTDSPRASDGRFHPISPEGLTLLYYLGLLLNSWI
jgi:hypothetical protein